MDGIESLEAEIASQINLDDYKKDDIVSKPNLYTEAIIEACDDIKMFLLEKNRCYGNSALEPQNLLVNLSAKTRLLVRIEDKINRLIKGSEYQGDDTLYDLAGYVILLKACEKLYEKYSSQNI